MSYKLIASVIFISLFSFNTQAVECGVQVDFKSIPTIKKNVYPITDNISMVTKSYLAYSKSNNARIATNISCQMLVGSTYAPIEKQWENIIATNFSELSKKGYKEVTLSTDPNNKFYKGNLAHNEYTITAHAKMGQQTFYVLNVFNDKKDILYNVLVSGDISITEHVSKEYQRVLQSIVFPE
ncbi:hypothetical protein [Thalassotalea sediminis]|uniref:hypothetical protein n=1 Tax=Thalassotalea sediminis TaxID=1759089 RepID=UPI0025738019|nr:hypothetical protein [Thalassotalea sediminis]